MLEKNPAVYQGEIEEKCAPKARRRIFGGRWACSKGKTLKNMLFCEKNKNPNHYFFRRFSKKIKAPGYFFRDPNLRKIKPPDDFPGFQTLKGSSESIV